MIARSDNNDFIGITELIRILDFDLERVYVTLDCGSELDYEFDIKAEDFIKFAEKDIVHPDTHGLVNSLSNSKRAIDCQVDKVLGCFGLLSKRKNFPKKMEILREMGIIAPRIVGKVVKARNYLEHEYQIPIQEEVEDALDIASLFITSLDRVLHTFPEQYIVGTITKHSLDEVTEPLMDKSLLISFNYNEPNFTLTGYFLETESESKNGIGKKVGQSVIMSNDKGYFELIKLSCCVDRENDPKLQFVNFISLFKTRV